MLLWERRLSIPRNSWVEKAVEERKYFFVPIDRKRVEGPITMVLGSADTLHAWRWLRRMGGNTDTRCLARELNAVSFDFEAASTSPTTARLPEVRERGQPKASGEPNSRQ